jgi:UDP-2-acetamido-2,6-beta-L-arabino-hexul-4-ose reductase
MQVKIKKLEVKKDERGWLAEIIRAEDIGNHPSFGQILVTTANPGQTKGNHYHLRKREWYCVIKGKGQVTITDRATKEVFTHTMGDENFVLVEIPVGTLHAITNIGTEEMILVVYISEPFNLQDPDTFYE